MARDPGSPLLGRIAWAAIGSGVVVTLAAVAWWASFFGGIVSRDPQGSLGNAIGCLYSARGVCGFIAGMARGGGTMAYSPALFWFGVCLLLSGAAMRLLLARRS